MAALNQLENLLVRRIAADAYEQTGSDLAEFNEAFAADPRFEQLNVGNLPESWTRATQWFFHWQSSQIVFPTAVVEDPNREFDPPVDPAPVDPPFPVEV